MHRCEDLVFSYGLEQEHTAGEKSKRHTHDRPLPLLLPHCLPLLSLPPQISLRMTRLVSETGLLTGVLPSHLHYRAEGDRVGDEAGNVHQRAGSGPGEQYSGGGPGH